MTSVVDLLVNSADVTPKAEMNQLSTVSVSQLSDVQLTISKLIPYVGEGFDQ